MPTKKKTKTESGQGTRKRVAKAKAEPKETKKATTARATARKAKAAAAPPPEPAPAPAPAKKATFARLLEVGREVLGIEELRPGQEEGLKHVLAGKNVLAVMPTGSGKSLLYQLPSLVLPGVTVVVSPLIALITDQVEKMRAKGAAVARVDSTLTVKQKREMLALVDAPGGKLVLTTPERMADPAFRKLLTQSAGKVGVSLFVVDEAHCVSQWGHDFRPSYLTLRQALEELGNPPVLATTATAPPHVRDDILYQLGIADAKIVTTSFERANLSFEVIASSGDDDKKKLLHALVKKLKRPAIIYCATVKTVEQLGEELTRHGVAVSTYHGRMTKNNRDAEQTRFMEKRSKLVMVATNAFGLGVDKADIRTILHYHVPGSLEAYAQEAGRGGRDGLPSRCVLLFSPDDVQIQEYFLKGTYPTRRQVHAVVDALAAWGKEARPPTLVELAMSSHVGRARTRTILELLKDESWVVEERGGRFHLSDPPPSPEAVRDRARDYEKRRVADRQRLDALLEYVRAPGCRNQIILGYLGEKGKTAKCGRCDNCLRSGAEARAAAERAAALEAVIARQSAEDEGELAPSAEEEAELRARLKAQRGKTRVISLDAPPPVVAPPPEVLEPDVEAVDSVDALDRTAAEIAADDSGEETEITVLKRKRRPKEPRAAKPKRQQAAPPPRHAADGKKKRRRRRRGKGETPRQSPLPFVSPVLRVGPNGSPLTSGPDGKPRLVTPVVTIGPDGRPLVPVAAPSEAPEASAAPPPPAAAPPMRGTRNGTAGPIVEYVRRPMKIAAAPVASATPHDSGRRRRRKDRGRDQGRPQGPPPMRQVARPPGPPPAPRPPNPGSVAPPHVHQVVLGPDGQPLEGRRKRRRRRKRKKKGGMEMTGGMPQGGPAPGIPREPAPPGGELHANGVQAEGTAAPPRPVSFWMPADRPFRPGENQQAGPPGEGRRKRRRRRRRKHGQGGQAQNGMVAQGAPQGSPAPAAPPSAEPAPAPRQEASPAEPPPPPRPAEPATE